ncbi:Thymidylate kinase [compost metagenome]
MPFATFEGLDFVGKTTQINILSNRLKKLGINVLSVREPGGTPIGDQIRSLLLDPTSVIHPVTEAMLYAASRAEHVNNVIRPALQLGTTVLCDRYVDSSIAYQGGGLQLGEMVAEINKIATQNLVPDRTYLIDISLEMMGERSQKAAIERGVIDRIEQRNIAYFDRTRNKLLEIAKNDPDRVLWINGALSVDEIAEIIWNDYQERMM